VDNIEMYLREMGSGDMDWIDLAKDMDQWKVLENMVINIRVPYNFGKFLRSIDSMKLVHIKTETSTQRQTCEGNEETLSPARAQ
jgi:hypothetical protein